MAVYVIMPKLGFNMDKGTLLKWRKKEGDFVEEQEVLFEIETDKTVMEVEAQTSGVLRKILVTEGEEVPVTLPIAIIGDGDEDISKMIKEAYQKLGKSEMTEEEPKAAKRISQGIAGKREIEPKKEKEESKKFSPRAQRKAKELGVKVQLVEGSGPGGAIIEKDVMSYYQSHKIKASPVAKKIAEKAGIKLDAIEKGTGIAGRIMKKDIEEALDKTEEMKKIEKKIPYTGMRKIIGDRISQSKFTAPHVYFTTSVDMSKVIDLLNRFNQDSEKRISINDFLVFTVAKVLSEQPNINCSLLGEEIVYHKDINIGVAVALKEGLIVPVIKNADKKSLSILSKETKKLIKLARERKLMPEDYNGGTFTISNLGMYGIDNFTAIINPPEAAILAVGTAKRIPVVIEERVEKLVVRSFMKVTLSVDHRLIDGAMAANFLNRLKYCLEFPKSLLLC
ncbi:2-oxo acid dehydrogenase subunit E2 [Candidatus Atribacteria bacterium HGW-Atribacteria-1]|nr:MAG: 2-oxo acid dehydrogenase subunit E2 [Candidatus Atribacteria bacterium HGW-Atribacteria-1]